MGGAAAMAAGTTAAMAARTTAAMAAGTAAARAPGTAAAGDQKGGVRPCFFMMALKSAIMASPG